MKSEPFADMKISHCGEEWFIIIRTPKYDIIRANKLRTASVIMPDTPGREHDQDQWWNVTKYIYSGVLLICSSDVMFCSFSILSENVVFCTLCY